MKLQILKWLESYRKVQKGFTLWAILDSKPAAVITVTSSKHIFLRQSQQASKPSHSHSIKPILIVLIGLSMSQKIHIHESLIYFKIAEILF